MTENPNKILCEDFVPYALGGRSSFTVKANGIYHYKISKKENKDKSLIWFVYCSLNGDEWKYLGAIDSDQKLKLTAKSEVESSSQIYLALNFVWYKASLGEPCDLIDIWHDGICSRCGRILTDEESVKRGLGPTCYLK